VPLDEGEADAFRTRAAGLVPAERLGDAIRRAKQGARVIETLAGPGRQCPALLEDQRCAIHARDGEGAKPRACRIFPMTFVATPAGVRVGLSFACPAVLDGEGPPLAEQRGEIESLFAAAVDGTRYLLRMGERVRLSREREIAFAEAERLCAAFSEALASDALLIERVCRAGAINALVQNALADGKSFDDAFAAAKAGSATLAVEALAVPPEVDRLSRAMFKTLLRSTANDPGALGRVARVFSSSVDLRFENRSVAWRAIEAVRPGLPADGEALLARWMRMQIDALTFFGDAAFGLSLSDGLDLLVLSAAAAVLLARAHAVGRGAVALDDVKRGLRQVDAGLTHRGAMPPGFDRALAATASLDLLREQLGA
jgi:lysine-N-methylase